MDLKEIKKIIELMDEHGLSQFKLEEKDSKLELKKGGLEVAPVQQVAAPAPVAAPQAPAASGDPSPAAAGDGLAPDEVEIPSPMVGTFYRASDPDSDSFVEIGSQVEESSPVCIIEAMKVMNEISADVKGTITQVLVENGTPVQYGEPLFRVKIG
ncbi:MAG: acetyl-CoA carboxylase biotin carboxyl carrier protein [Verrucomicrobiales bacterium]|nr:acetyl-CoA carboxylase biotin carboxyl carrier protein [Verrucomicrobiales bacterium]